MVVELDGLPEQWKVGHPLVEEELDVGVVDAKREALEEGDVVVHNLLLSEVVVVDDQIFHDGMREEVGDVVFFGEVGPRVRGRDT